MNEIGSKVSDVMQLAKLKSYIDKKVDEKSNKILIALLCAIFAVLAIAGAVVVFLSVFQKKKKKNYAMYDEGFYDFDDGPCYYPGDEMKSKYEKNSETAKEPECTDKCAEAEKKTVDPDECKCDDTEEKGTSSEGTESEMAEDDEE